MKRFVLALMAVIAVSACAAPRLEQTPTSAAPKAALFAAAERVDGAPFEACWVNPDGQGDTCRSNENPEPARALVVDRGAHLVLEYSRTDEPNSVVVTRFTDVGTVDVEHEGTNPVKFRADFPSGTHELDIASNWQQGHVTHVFEVRVR